MSMFAKVFIIVNFVLSLVLGFLLGALLVQKFDYKAKFVETTKQAQTVQSLLTKWTDDFEAQRLALSGKLSRYEKKKAELAKRNAALNGVIKNLNDQLRAVNREVAKLESDQQSLDNSVTELKGRDKTLREEIKRLETEREDSIAKTKTYNDEADTLYQSNLNLLEALRAEEKKMNKLAKRVSTLEKLWFTIIKRRPGLKIRIQMRDIKGSVTKFNPALGLVTINKGRDDGVKIAGKFVVSRGANFVCVLEIYDVKKREAVGRLSENSKGRGWPPQPGDAISTDSPAKERK